MTWKNLVKWVIGLHLENVYYENGSCDMHPEFICVNDELYFYPDGEIVCGWGDTIAENRSNRQMKNIIESLL